MVIRAHKPAVDLATQLVNGEQSTVTTDQVTLLDDTAQAATAAADAGSAQARLTADMSLLSVAAGVNRAAQGRLALDRERLRGFALGIYTGALTGPLPAALQNLSDVQQADLGRGEAEIVAGIVVRDLHSDVVAGAGAGRLLRQVQALVTEDGNDLAVARHAAATAAARLHPDRVALAADQRRLATGRRQLQVAQAVMTAALAAVLGSPSQRSGGLTVLGTAALDATQLAAWYDAQGYVDLTAVPIQTFATWYLQEGVAEGIRGDVAFAQAVLETGGFSSPDAVARNNYAGIGHCDSCPAGWAFPSPQAGVIGHLQLLHIFATPAPAPAQAPKPVLPALTPAHQGRTGCCPTWEALTGVWATDPLYAVSILAMYQSMLSFAATLPPPATPTSVPASPAAGPTSTSATTSSPAAAGSRAGSGAPPGPG
jgi:hypothetical protein